VGLETSDDAGVYQLTPDLALVQTVDFFTPIVDDPFTFGQIAVANALSDVYAMGGRPLTAMNLVAFPVEIKYGLSVTGLVHPKKILSNAKAIPGDRLVLTKPIGTGIIATALKGGMASEKAVRQMVESMTALNRKASEKMQALGAHACTDITGFGLIGHGLEMANASHVGLRIWASKVPVFPEAMEYARIGLIPAGAYSNRQFFSCRVDIHPSVSVVLGDLFYDPQTSGGLLISLPPREAEQLVGAFREGGDHVAAIVGEVVKEPKGRMEIV
jgi:selenide,water dikinase